MTKRKMLAIAGAVAAFGAAAATFSLQSALAEDAWKGVTIVYQTDVKGKIEPCG